MGAMWFVMFFLSQISKCHTIVDNNFENNIDKKYILTIIIHSCESCTDLMSF
jgi:hypothetical protein